MYAEGIFLKSPRVEHGRSLPLSFLFKVVCVCSCMSVPHAWRSPQRLERVSDPLKLKLQVAVNGPMWVLTHIL